MSIDYVTWFDLEKVYLQELTCLHNAMCSVCARTNSIPAKSWQSVTRKRVLQYQ